MAQRFQGKELNKEDHKKIDKAADDVKKGVGVISVLGTIVTIAVKYKKPIAKAVKNIVKK